MQWDNSEDRIALIGLGFAAIVAIWASANLVTVIISIPYSLSVNNVLVTCLCGEVLVHYLNDNDLTIHTPEEGHDQEQMLQW